MSIARFSPISDVVSLREAMDRLFEDSFIRPNGSWSGLNAGQVAVPVDLWETQDASHLRADLPTVPLREAVAFPKLVVPLGVGREKSVAAINAAMAEDKHYVILAAQKDAEIDDVKPDQVYAVGTLAEIVRLLRIPDGSAQIIVQGLNRVRIKEYLPE